MLLDVNDNIEIALVAAADARFAIVRGAQPRAVGDPGRDLDFDPAGFFGPAFAVADVARSLDHFAESAAARAGLRDLEKSARADDLAAPATGRAGDRARAGRGAAALTLVAGVELAHFDFFFHAESRFLERDLHVVTQIASALAAVGSACAAAEKGLEDSARRRRRCQKLRGRYQMDRGTRRARPPWAKAACP